MHDNSHFSCTYSWKQLSWMIFLKIFKFLKPIRNMQRLLFLRSWSVSASDMILCHHLRVTGVTILTGLFWICTALCVLEIEVGSKQVPVVTTYLPREWIKQTLLWLLPCISKAHWHYLILRPMDPKDIKIRLTLTNSIDTSRWFFTWSSASDVWY